MVEIIITILMFIAVCSTNTVAQSSLCSQSSKKEKHICGSDYSIDYVKSGQRESIYSSEDKNRVWVRFTNKSQKTLKIEASDGQQTLDYLKGIDKEVAVYYEVVDKENCNFEDKEIKELPIGYTRRETYIEIELKPEESLIFSVAQQYLLPNRAIYITYKCSQKCGRGEKDKVEKAYYFTSELTKAVKQDK